ncbi:hypothetical protein CCHR01_14042 [Colletotrichum chrysophilum]|uniref:Uncharacterized protein n=1 Tax=Colletotrichum chrysophilum TaxID=1836956 RepID=A0AAD9ED53_9PEZI|nr:hypothetical protein CCHR01_14042 [Colletotrichum chrysophilum]
MEADGHHSDTQSHLVAGAVIRVPAPLTSFRPSIQMVQCGPPPRHPGWHGRLFLFLGLWRHSLAQPFGCYTSPEDRPRDAGGRGRSSPPSSSIALSSSQKISYWGLTLYIDDSSTSSKRPSPAPVLHIPVQPLGILHHLQAVCICYTALAVFPKSDAYLGRSPGTWQNKHQVSRCLPPGALLGVESHALHLVPCLLHLPEATLHPCALPPPFNLPQHRPEPRNHLIPTTTCLSLDLQAKTVQNSFKSKPSAKKGPVQKKGSSSRRKLEPRSAVTTTNVRTPYSSSLTPPNPALDALAVSPQKHPLTLGCDVDGYLPSSFPSPDPTTS